VSILIVLGIGFFRVLTGDIPAPVAPPEAVPVTQGLAAFLVLRAFASGSVGLSGTEAVANGVTAFKAPAARNAGIVLIVMGALFGTLFFAISFLATRIGIQVDHTETKSVVGLLAQSIVGDGWPFWQVGERLRSLDVEDQGVHQTTHAALRRSPSPWRDRGGWPK